MLPSYLISSQDDRISLILLHLILLLREVTIRLISWRKLWTAAIITAGITTFFRCIDCLWEEFYRLAEAIQV